MQWLHKQGQVPARMHTPWHDVQLLHVGHVVEVLAQLLQDKSRDQHSCRDIGIPIDASTLVHAQSISFPAEMSGNAQQHRGQRKVGNVNASTPLLMRRGDC